MARISVWETGFVFLTVFGTLTFTASVKVPLSYSVCPLNSVKDSIFGVSDLVCGVDEVESFGLVGVIEVDEVLMPNALNVAHKVADEYVAVLFYASWCPFSRTFKPSFSIMSSLYPSIPHFAIEESVTRPSILSKFGVHGYPTLFLSNSTMRTRYLGSRTIDSLVAFYRDVTGLDTAASVDRTSLTRNGRSSDHEMDTNREQESCPFSWARSPENLLRQETYLTLATIFVFLRLLYLIFPSLRVFSQFAWRRRYIVYSRLRSLWEQPLAYLNRAIQLFSSLKEPCKRSNLQEGAMNAKAWASKSLASVSFGDGSTSRVMP